MIRKTFQEKKENVTRNWHLIDIGGKILGRASVEIAELLIGKNKVTYTTHVDMGDHVVVINAKDVKLSGKKEDQKVYYKHSGFIGKLKTITYKKVKEEKPQEVVKRAVYGMIPDNKLKKDRLARLHIFVGSEHNFTNKFEVKK